MSRTVEAGNRPRTHTIVGNSPAIDGEILERVTYRLGPYIELHLAVRADNTAGFDDTTQRIVSEEATNLGPQATEFE